MVVKEYQNIDIGKYVMMDRRWYGVVALCSQNTNFTGGNF